MGAPDAHGSIRALPSIVLKLPMSERGWSPREIAAMLVQASIREVSSSDGLVAEFRAILLDCECEANELGAEWNWR